MIEQETTGPGWDLVSATRDEFERRGGTSYRQLGILLEIERLNRLVQALAQPHLASTKLTYAGWQALMALAYSTHQALPIAKLAERVSSHPTTMTRTIDRLIRLGYVRRGQKENDRRVSIIEILPDGDRAREEVLRSLDRSQFGFEGLPDERLDLLQELLQEVRTVLTTRVER